MQMDAALNQRFRDAWLRLLQEIHAVPLFADAGLPAHPGLFAEIGRRIFSRLLPSARADADAGLLFISIFSTRQAVERFDALSTENFEQLAKLLWPPRKSTRPSLFRKICAKLCGCSPRASPGGVQAPQSAIGAPAR